MFLHATTIVQATRCCLETWRSSREGQGVEFHMSVPDAWIEATWYCDQTSQASQRKLPRGLRSLSDRVRKLPRSVPSPYRKRVLFGAASCLCLALVVDRGSMG
jgi:hypothetical protein